jgi:hypothetical protein
MCRFQTHADVSPAKFQSLLQTAVTHHRAGRLDEAEACYRQLRVAAPKNFDGLHLSGLVAYPESSVFVGTATFRPCLVCLKPWVRLWGQLNLRGVPGNV